jgi:S-methylmethionine-dependent homocysteine/selenocysteine methylase
MDRKNNYRVKCVKSFREFLKEKKVVIFDGAIRAELLNRGYPQDELLEYANIIERDMVLSIHREYRGRS